MFDASGHCLFARDEMQRRFADWDVLHAEHRDFAAVNEHTKAFVTLVARKPGAGACSV